jgi:hypothetical protein
MSTNPKLSITIPEIPESNTVLASSISDKPVVLDPTQIVVMTNLAQVLLESIPLPAYNLTIEQKSWIQEFIRASPTSFEKIVADINAITADGKIDVHDIPVIVKLFADVYHSGAINTGLVNTKNVIAFIKFTLDVILDSKLLVLPDIQKKTIEAVVDASLSLLAMNIETIDAVKKKWYDYFTDACPSWSK